MALNENYDANGKLQYNDELFTFALRKTIAIATQASGFGNEVSLLVVPNVAALELVALNCADGYSATVTVNSGQAPNRYFTTDAPIGTVFNVYIYSVSYNLAPTSSFGVADDTFNASGQITFSMNYRFLLGPALFQNVGGVNQQTGDRYFPTFTRAGKKLGFCLLGYGGIKEYSNIEPDSGGYNYSHYWYGFGAGLAGGQATITTTEVITVNGGFFTPDPNFNFNNVYDVPCSILVVDVTGIPMGVTFF